MPYETEIKEVAARPTAVIQFAAAGSEMGEKLGEAFGAVMQYVSKAGAQIAGPAFAYYEQLGHQRFDVRAGFIVAASIEGNSAVLPFELPAARVATTTHVGAYEKLSESYAALAEQTKVLGEELEMTAPMWEEYLSEPDTPPEQTRTIVYWPVKQQ
jgi:effector-binding domain-containing protein